MSSSENNLSRRQHLKLLGSAAIAGILPLSGVHSAAAAGRATASQGPDAVEDYDFLFTRVKFDMNVGPRAADWNCYPGAERYLLQELSSVVRCKTKLPPDCSAESPAAGQDYQFNAIVTFEDDPKKLRDYPFLFMTGEGVFTFSTAQKAALKQYIEEGGFILIDDCVLAPSGDHLYQSAYRTLDETFGAGSVVSVPKEHEIFHNVYDLGNIGLPHCQGKNHGAKAVFMDDRLAVFLSSTDIHCGWVDKQGIWFPNPALGRHGHKEAIQMGINIVMYSLSH